MYPHIFVDNIKTGSTTIRCDCTNVCATKELEIKLKIDDDDKLFCYGTEKSHLLYKNDSTAIGKWSQQVSNYYPINAETRPVSFFNPSDVSPPASYTPHQSRPTYSSDTEDQISESNEWENELMTDAGNFFDSTRITDDTAADAAIDSMEMSQEEDVEHCSTSHFGYTGFENLIMLADEAVKRIKQERE